MESFKATFGDFSPVLHGVIVSSILLTGAISALFAGVVAQQLGYAKVIALGSLVYSIGAAIECGSSVLGIFIFGRLLKGLGTGLFISNIYVQISETSPFKVRGILTALPQFTIVFGLAMGYFICYGTARLAPSSASWRVPFALASGLGLLASMTYFIMPTSPRWLLARGKIDEARTTVEKLGWDEEEIRQFLSEPSTSEEAEVAELSFKESIKQMFHGFRETFSAPFRARTIFGCFTMASQQFSGIDGVLYYAPILFTQAGLKSNEANFLASGISAIVILVTTLPATLLADSWGRKTSCVTGGVAMTGLMLLMGSLYASNQVHATYGAGKWVVIVSIYLFAVVFSGTWAVAIRTSLVESAPRKTRSSASSLAQSANWVSNSFEDHSLRFQANFLTS